MQEELGRNTNGVWWNMGGGYNVLARGTDEQIRRYLEPTLRGERADAYAVTEAGAGSDPGGIAATAERTPSGWRIRAEKWFVTSGDVADFDIVMVNVVDGGRTPADAVSGRPRPARHRCHRRPAVHPLVPSRPPHRPLRLRGRRRRGARRRRHDRARRRAPERVVHRGADPHRRPLRRRDAAAARRRGRVGDRPRAVRRADLRLPGHQLPAGRLGGRLRRRPPPDLPGGRHGGHRRRPQARPRPRGDGQAVCVRGRLALRRPLRPGARRPRLHAHVRGRAVPARAARRPHLGGHQRDPAPDHRPRPREARRRAPALHRDPDGS